MKQLLCRPIAGNLAAMRVNRTLHGRSRWRKINVEGHNVYKGYNTPGTGDGVDYFCAAGTQIKSMIDGKVTHIGERNGVLSCMYIEGIHEGHNITIVYAHVSIKPSILKRSEVKRGMIVGFVGKLLKDPHLHMEVWIDGVALNDKTPKGLAAKIAGLCE